jgi:hypothetical protein
MKSFLLNRGCFLVLVKYFLLMSQIKTIAPLDKHIFVVAQPIPEAPADISIFLFFKD